MAEKLNLLSYDLGLKTKNLITASTNIVMYQGNMTWGEDMFGSETILGAAYLNFYLSGGTRHILSDDFSLNMKKL